MLLKNYFLKTTIISLLLLISCSDSNEIIEENQGQDLLSELHSFNLDYKEIIDNQEKNVTTKVALFGVNSGK